MIMILLLTALSTTRVASFLRKFGRICPDCTLVSNLREIEGENTTGKFCSNYNPDVINLTLF